MVAFGKSKATIIGGEDEEVYQKDYGRGIAIQDIAGQKRGGASGPRWNLDAARHAEFDFRGCGVQHRAG